MTRITLALLIYASLASAQTWEWEQYQGTFWHQAPDIPFLDFDGQFGGRFSLGASGDFNGNGRDEIVIAEREWYYHWETANAGTFLDWWERNQFQSFVGADEEILFMYAINLDTDVNDELIVCSYLYDQPEIQFVRCFDPDSIIAPHFIERPEYLEALAYPAWPSPSMLGDFDGDGLLDGFSPTQNGWLHYEFENDVWELEETIDIVSTTEYSLFLAADINSDGDMEFGAYEPGMDCNCLLGTIVDYANGQTTIQYGIQDVLLYPGDYDGDGNTESFIEGFELSLPSRLVRLSAGEPFSYTELANQWEANSPVVYSLISNGENRLFAFMNGQGFQFVNWIMVPVGYRLQWNDSEWTWDGDGGAIGAFYEGNTSDMDADGENEYIYRMLVNDGWTGEQFVWSSGIGNLTRFFRNQDTLFTNPRIGDVEGDGAGELVTRVASGAPVGIYFYELERVGNELLAHHQPHLSVGLPTNITEFTLADIDNDGHAELFINTGFWRSFFWRNGQWEEYSNILPTGIGLNLYFADFDGDGDLDVFSQNGVWISLSPTAADDAPFLQPSSFILSAYPNPFNAQTTIQFDLPRASEVTLELYDVLGRKVQTLLNEPLTAGTHTHNFAAQQLPSGVYFAKLISNEYNATQKLLLLK